MNRKMRVLLLASSLCAIGQWSVAAQSSQPLPLDTPGLAFPRLVTHCGPHYTPEALRAGISGRVQLRVRVDAEGRVERANVVASLDKEHGLDGEAMFAVAKWIFLPATLRGVPVAVDGVIVEMSFSQLGGRPLQEGGCRSRQLNPPMTPEQPER